MRITRTLLVAVLAIGLGLTPARATTTPVSTGTLHWGFKQSFRSYVGDAGISLGDGATRAGDGTFAFPLSGGSYDDTARATDVSLAGSVHFRAHPDGSGGYLLDITVSAPHVRITGTGASLTMHVLSRGLLDGGAAGPVVDYGEIPVAALDVSTGTVSTAGGSTAWSAIRATLTAEAVPAFLTYSAGTALDPVAFSYTGPGGAPGLSESWTAPSTPLLRAGPSWSAGTVLDVDAAYADPAHGVAYAVLGSLAPHSVQALDATTLAPLGGGTALGPQTRYLSAFDPATSTVFVAQDDGTIGAARWDGRAYVTTSVATVPDGVAALLGLTWDAAGHRLVAIVSAGDTAAVYAWTGPAWTQQIYPLPAPPSGQSVAAGWYGSPRNLHNLAAAPDGSLVLARGSITTSDAAAPALRVGLAGGSVTVASIAGTAFVAPDGDQAPSVGYGQVVIGGDGALYLLRTQQNSAVARLGTSGVTWRLDLPDTQALGLAVDTDSTVYVGAPNSKQIAIVRDGQVLRTQTVDDLGSRLTYFIAIGADHAVLTETRGAGFPLGVTRLDRAGVSPSILTPPAGATAVLRPGASTGQVTFAVRIEGTPAPQIRWQRRDPGAATFTDLPGATGPTLPLAVTAADRGASVRAVATNAAGAIASPAATITVRTAPPASPHPPSKDPATPAGDPTAPAGPEQPNTNHGGELAATGTVDGRLAGLGLVAVLVGVALSWLGRRRGRST